jgi:hypothetical protein
MTVVNFATVVKFVTIRKHLGKAGVVANESTRCSHAPAKHSTRCKNSHQQCNKVVVASPTDFCLQHAQAQCVINSDHCTCFTFWYDLAQAKTYPGLLSTTKMYCTSTVKKILDAVSQGDPLNKLFK